MTNVDEGRVRAYLDGELSTEESATIEARMRENQAVRDRVAAASRQDDEVSDLLASLDRAPPTDRVRGVLEERLSSAMGENVTRGRSRWGVRLRDGRARLAKAAGLVLLFAGAASAALPGSPVRGWIGWTAGQDAQETTLRSSANEAPAAESEGGARVLPLGGTVELELRDVPPATEILVSLVEGDGAAMFAPAAEWEGQTGRITGIVTAGPVRVEIPRSAARASLRVNGRIYMTKQDGRLDLAGPATETTDTTIRFRSGS